MKLCLISLYLYVLSTWSVKLNTVNVRQTADFDVFEGEAVDISCCWTGGSRVRVTWFKNQTTLKNDSFLTNPHQETQKDEMEKCSFWNFDSIKKQDSGRYDCEIFIEIPELTKVRGNGTIITVRTRENQTVTTTDPAPPSRPSNILQTISLPVVLLLFFISISFFLFLHEPRNHALTTTVIYTGSAGGGVQPRRGRSQRESQLISLICYNRDETKGSGSRSAAVSSSQRETIRNL
ncbi:uncharacterized protein LOC110017076 [Oryzias latipes]|uniref:uncharacterized protein LOC110017076 n=1 Tax=Oryzias latipes TaxID=8090 RepID=UPI0009DA870C|nr:uncharacterized protein LOC110017076 [Oryzias latipes]